MGSFHGLESFIPFFFVLGVWSICELVEEFHRLGESTLYKVYTVGAGGEVFSFQCVIVELMYDAVHCQHLLRW